MGIRNGSHFFFGVKMILWIIILIVWIVNLILRLITLKDTKGNGFWIVACLLWIFVICPLNIAMRLVKDEKVEEKIEEIQVQYESEYFDGEYTYVYDE